MLADAEESIRRSVLGPFDGFNTVRRCRSAREHLLCGLQDVLEHVLLPVGPRCVCVCVCVCVERESE
jgi:hypothetical protein